MNEKYAVIFISQSTHQDEAGYAKTAQRMVELAKQQEGYLGIHSVLDETGKGITISYWNSLHAINNWKNNMEHADARKRGRESWYEKYILQICRVEHEYTWKATHKS